MSPTRSIVGVSLGLALVMGGCKAAEAPMPPGGSDVQQKQGGETQSPAGDELQQLELELAQAEEQLHGATSDHAIAAKAGPDDGASPEAATTRCERITTLAEHICGLRDRMCTLADEHEGEDRYAQACGRAEQTCERAEQAAQDCPAG